MNWIAANFVVPIVMFGLGTGFGYTIAQGRGRPAVVTPAPLATVTGLSTAGVCVAVSADKMTIQNWAPSSVAVVLAAPAPSAPRLNIPPNGGVALSGVLAREGLWIRFAPGPSP